MASREVGFVVTEEYRSWINDVKMRIKQSQIKASVKINYELLDLYWELGRDIVSKQEHAKWGDSFLNVMSKDLQKAFPGMSGFSNHCSNCKVIQGDFYLFGEVDSPFFIDSEERAKQLKLYKIPLKNDIIVEADIGWGSEDWMIEAFAENMDLSIDGMWE